MSYCQQIRNEPKAHFKSYVLDWVQLPCVSARVILVGLLVIQDLPSSTVSLEIQDFLIGMLQEIIAFRTDQFNPQELTIGNALIAIFYSVLTHNAGSYWTCSSCKTRSFWISVFRKLIATELTVPTECDIFFFALEMMIGSVKFFRSNVPYYCQ